MYNKVPNTDYTSFDALEIKLHNGTKVVLFHNPERNGSVAGNEPIEFDSDGNEIREDYCSSKTSGPPIYNSDGNEI